MLIVWLVPQVNWRVNVKYHWFRQVRSWSLSGLTFCWFFWYQQCWAWIEFVGHWICLWCLFHEGERGSGITNRHCFNLSAPTSKDDWNILYTSTTRVCCQQCVRIVCCLTIDASSPSRIETDFWNNARMLLDVCCIHFCHKLDSLYIGRSCVQNPSKKNIDYISWQARGVLTTSIGWILCSPSFREQFVLVGEMESLVVLKPMFFILSVVKLVVVLALLEPNCKRKISYIRSIFLKPWT